MLKLVNVLEAKSRLANIVTTGSASGSSKSVAVF